MSISYDSLGVVSALDCLGRDTQAWRCQVITDLQSLMELQAQWATLWQSDPRAEIFQTPEWHRIWWNSFGKKYKLCAIAIFAGEELKGILPLARSGAILQFAAVPQGDYADIICEDCSAAEVIALALQTLLDEVHGWHECSFVHLSKHSRLIRHSQHLPYSLRSRLQRVSDEPQYTIIFRNQREALFRALLGKQHTKRLQKKLEKTGQLRFRHLHAQSEIEQNVSDFLLHHVRRHAALGRQSVCADPEFGQFLRLLAQELVPVGRMRFGVLELDGRALAWDLGFEVNGKFLLYQHTFDLDFWHYTPGEVLLWHELQYARDHVSREFDFGRGDETYKDRFCNYSRETYSLFFEPSGIRGSIRLWARSVQAFTQPVLSKLKKLAKSRRFGLRAFRSLRVKLTESANCVREAPQKRSLLGCGLRLTKGFVGKSILSKRWSDVYALPPEQNRMPKTVASDDPSLQVCVARLGELVDLAWAHPQILSLNDLPECRSRLKNGDRPYIARQGAKVAIGCWLSRVATESFENLSLDRVKACSGVMMDEFWSARDCNLSPHYERLISVLVNEAAIQSVELLVQCRSDQRQLRDELERQGFRRRFQAVGHGIFSRLRQI